ncbi:MAG: hypothetical protein HY537_07040 [Deltaproteobacteria bacterium]|nr:hypothetical protein [Deltaproteobacteria bacterium]
MNWQRLVLLFAILATFVRLYADEVSPGNQSRVQLGVSLALLLPNGLPDFDASMPAFGSTIGLRCGPGSIIVQGLYGSKEGITLYLLESGYQLPLSTPFFDSYVQAGLHHLRYSFASRENAYSGANFGFGFFLFTSKSFVLRLGAQLYFQARSIASICGGFSFHL